MATLCNSCEQQESCKIFEIMGDSMPITHCKNYIQTRRETVRVKQTNADRIRAMTDEELALFLNHVGSEDCRGCDDLLAWLREEKDDG